jgi:hypothetical protein
MLEQNANFFNENSTELAREPFKAAIIFQLRSIDCDFNRGGKQIPQAERPQDA